MSDDDHLAPPSPSTSPSLSPLPIPPPPDNELLALPVQPLSREDCWSEEATHTLIQAWGFHYMNLNRGKLRCQHWQQIADAVNVLHAHTKKQYRTGIQCKYRMDTLKKKYKVEKAGVVKSPDRYVSTWPFFRSLSHLIGVDVKLSPSPEGFTAQRLTPPPPSPPPPPPLCAQPLFGVPVGLRPKRPAAPMAYTVYRRDFAAMAAAVEESDQEEEENEEMETSGVAAGRSRRKGSGGSVEGYNRLAEALGRFSETYERVERLKQRQMVELEMQRMQFAKDLELQRMKLIMEYQVHLQKLKRSKHIS